MRIGIALFQFFSGRIGGAGDYIERLVPGLLQVMDWHDELILLGTAQNLEPFDSLNDPRLKRVIVPWSRRWIQILRFADLVLPFSPSRLFSPDFNRLQLDVVLYPQQSIFPRGINSPAVVSVMDLLHFRYPRHVRPWQRWLRKRKESHFVRTCAQTVSISQATRSDLLKFYPIAPEKCSVVYLAGRAPHDEVAVNPVPPGAPYAYYPANSFPHKNHGKLLQAFRAFRNANPNLPARLVLSGQCSPQLQSVIKSDFKHVGILHLGYLSRAEVAAVYSGCRAVIIPSVFEGFGMPLVEGLGYARPVFCSDLPVFRELAGDIVQYFDPTSVPSLTGAFSRMFEMEPAAPDPQRVKDLLSRLNWDRCAAETYAILVKSRS